MGHVQRKDSFKQMDSNGELPVFWPLGMYFAGVVAVVGGMIISSYVLGARSRNRKNF